MGLFRRNKNNNKPIIRQILDLVPRWLFESCTTTYKTDKGVNKYKAYDQFVSLTFGQLNKCQSLNDISAGNGVSEIFISDLGLSQSPTRSTMSDGNKNRDWHVFESLDYRLLSHYNSILKQDHNTHIIKEIKGKAVKLIDSSTISLCLAMFDWAKFRTAKGGIKLHTSWDYNTIAELYKKRWDIELFFKALKQNLQVKTFWGTSENAVKSQIYVALINYLLIKRTISKKIVAFSNLLEKTRFYRHHYLSGLCMQ